MFLGDTDCLLSLQFRVKSNKFLIQEGYCYDMNVKQSYHFYKMLI